MLQILLSIPFSFSFYKFVLGIPFFSQMHILTIFLVLGVGADDVAVTSALLEKNGLQPSIMIDASHANCGKQHERMPEVFAEIVRQRCAGNKHVIGVMLESNLIAGNQSFPQPIDNLTYGQSITDQCIDWDTTESIVRNAARDLKQAGVVG